MLWGLALCQWTRSIWYGAQWHLIHVPRVTRHVSRTRTQSSSLPGSHPPRGSWWPETRAARATPAAAMWQLTRSLTRGITPPSALDTCRTCREAGPRWGWSPPRRPRPDTCCPPSWGRAPGSSATHTFPCPHKSQTEVTITESVWTSSHLPYVSTLNKPCLVTRCFPRVHLIVTLESRGVSFSSPPSIIVMCRVSGSRLLWPGSPIVPSSVASTTNWSDGESFREKPPLKSYTHLS